MRRWRLTGKMRKSKLFPEVEAGSAEAVSMVEHGNPAGGASSPCVAYQEILSRIYFPDCRWLIPFQNTVSEIPHRRMMTRMGLHLLHQRSTSSARSCLLYATRPSPNILFMAYKLQMVVFYWLHDPEMLDLICVELGCYGKQGGAEAAAEGMQR